MSRNARKSKLDQYAQRNGMEVHYEVMNKGPKNVTVRCELDGQHYIGNGSSLEKAKENAANFALRSLSEKENCRPPATHASKNPNVCQKISTLCIGDKEDVAWKAKKKVERRIVLGEKRNGNNQVGAVGLHPDRIAAEVEFQLRSSSTACGNGGSSTDSSSLGLLQLSESSSGPEVQEDISAEEISSEMPLDHTQNIRSLAEFTTKEKLGRGAYGRVYKVTHNQLQKDYAVKMVPWKKNALQEARALANLHHENVIQFFDCWIDESPPQSESSDGSWSTSQSSEGSSNVRFCIRMELCANDTLREWIDDQNVMELFRKERRKEGRKFMLEILCGIEYIHSMGFIHRDLKPGNIMFGLDGKTKIGDFGLVAVNGDEQVERSLNKGTESYMAPEQRGELPYDKKVDMFSLGLIHFELVWKISTYHERRKIWDDVRAQKLPKKFAHKFWEEFCIIWTMLSEKPEDRPHASEVKTHLERLSFDRLRHVEHLKNHGARSV